MATNVKETHYICADLHLGHKNAHKMPGRTHFETSEDHDNYIVQQIQETCGPNDFLWILGDAAFTCEGLQKLKGLSCHLGLIGGNHDDNTAHKYLEIFDQYRGMATGTVNGFKVVYTHVPVHLACLDRWTHNIHGHLHTESIKYSQAFVGHVRNPKYICVSLEQTGFKPVLISSLLEYDYNFRIKANEL